MPEQLFADVASTTTTSLIDSSQTTINVASSANFPTAISTRDQEYQAAFVDAATPPNILEYITVRNTNSSTQWLVIRQSQNSTRFPAGAWASGTRIVHVVTAAGFRGLLAKSRNVYHDVRDYGAVGTNDTNNVGAIDNTAAIQDACDAANVSIGQTYKTDQNGTGYVYLPGNRDYKITATIDWPQNVRFFGGTGSGRGTAAPPTIRWHGAAGGTMLRHQTDNPNIIGMHFENVRLEGRSLNVGSGASANAGYLQGAAYGVWWGPITTGAAKPDTGCQFIDVWISGCHEAGLSMNGVGLTNFVWTRGRFDQIGGYAIYTKSDANCFLTISDMTYDNWAASDADNSGRSKGFLFLDGQTGNGHTFVSLRSLHLEVNGGYAQTYLPTGWTPTGCDSRGLIRLGVNTGASNVVQHVVEFSNIWVPVNPTWAHPFSIFQITSPDLASDNRARHAAAVRIEGMGMHALSNGTSPFGENTMAAVKMVGGVNAADNYPFNPASGGVRQPGIFSFPPPNATSVPSQETPVNWISHRTVMPRLNLPSRSTVGGAGGGTALPATPVKYLDVYDENGTRYQVPAYTAGA